MSLIVKDQDKTLDYYRSLGLVTAQLEISREERVPVAYEVHGERKPTPPDSPRKGPGKIGVFRMGPLIVEMIQPGEASSDANSEYIDTKGEGISHLAFFVDDIEAETTKLVGKGIPMLLTERVEGKVISHYFDTREYGGLVLELKQKGAFPDWEHGFSTWRDIRENHWRLFHISLVVKDLDRTMAYYESLGLVTAQLEISGREGSRVTYEKHTERKPAPPDSPRKGPGKVRVFRMGPLIIEMMQTAQTSYGINAEYIDHKGEGVSHLAFFVDDIEAETAKLVDKGIALALTERVEGKVISHYFDTREYGGLALELKQKGALPDWESP